MTEKGQPDPLSMIAKLEKEEQKLSETVFMAPVISGCKVRVRISGIVYELSVSDTPDFSGFSGWGLLRVIDTGHAQVVGNAKLTQIKAYLDMLPKVRMTVLDQYKGVYFALPAAGGDKRFEPAKPVPINLVLQTASFDQIIARFDGAAFWFDSADRRRNPSVSRTLRKALEDDVTPKDLYCKEMVPQERRAYQMMWLDRHPELQDALFEGTDDASRVRAALRHAGATLDTFWIRGDNHLTVRYIVDGVTHVSEIRPSDLSVLSAGICLAGQDANFDLSSLVGVMREARSPNRRNAHDEEW